MKRIVNTVPGATTDTIVCSYSEKGKIKQLHSSHARLKIRGIVELIGEKALGVTKDDVGLHSVRSGGAMAMFLSGISGIIIQRIDRWESFAFLDYIREQVEDSTQDVLKKMLQVENFQHMNDEHLGSQYQDLWMNHIKEGDGDSNFVPLSIHFSRRVLRGEEDRGNSH